MQLEALTDQILSRTECRFRACRVHLWTREQIWAWELWLASSRLPLAAIFEGGHYVRLTRAKLDEVAA